MKLSNLKATFMAAAVAATFAAPAVQAQESIRVASFTAQSAIGVKGVMIPWMEKVSAELGDKVNMTGFWGGSLGKSPFQQYDLIKNGVADAGWVVAGYAPGRFPQLHALELPLMANNGVEASAVEWHLFEKGMLDGVGDFKVFALWAPTGDILHMVEPITSLEDIKGLKIRSSSSAHAQTIEALGGVPQTIGPAEVNDALARGAVEGLVQGLTGMKSFGTFNVVKMSYAVPFGNTTFLFLMNKKKWESLPADVQAVMDKHAGLQMSLAAGKAYDDETASIIEQKKAEGYPIVQPAAEELAKYNDAFLAVHKKWIESTPNGQAVYDEIKSFLADYRKSAS